MEMRTKKQRSLVTRDLEIGKVFENLQKLASIGGKGSKETKISLIKELISNAKPKEAKYIVRTVLGQLRVGVAEGVLRDSIAGAFFEAKDAEEDRLYGSARGDELPEGLRRRSDRLKRLRECQERLNQIRPVTFGQASRIAGVKPADIAVLHVYMERLARAVKDSA
jgi:ATP-dependent DNA ligase